MFRNVQKVINTSIEVSDIRRCVPVDNFDAQTFNLNDAGWSRNDICQLARAQSQSEYDAIMHRLVTLPDKKGLSDSLSKAEKIRSIKPRYCQSNMELQSYAEYVATVEQNKLNEAYEKAVSETGDTDVKSVDDAVVTPSPDVAQS